MATTVDTLLVRIEADLSDLKRELDRGSQAVDAASKKMADSTKKAETGFQSLGNTLRTVIGVAAVASLARAGKASLDAAGALGELADTAGLTKTAFQELVYAGSQVGLSQEQVTQSFAIFSRTIGDAANGNAQMIKTFRDLGVTILDANGKLKSNDVILNAVADAIAQIPDPAKRTAVAMDLFGRSGAKLVPLLKDGSAGLEEFKRRAHEMGLVLTDEAVDAADKTSDKIVEMEAAFSKLGQTLAAKVAPGFYKVIEGWRLLIQEVTKEGGAKSFAEQLTAINAEIARLENGIGRGAGTQARLEMLRAKREALLAVRSPDDASPASPTTTGTTGGGTNPTSDAAAKMLQQIELQKRLAMVTGESMVAIERERTAIEARAKAIAGDLVGDQVEQYVSATLAIYDLTEAEKASIEMDKEADTERKKAIENLQKLRDAKEQVIATAEREVADNAQLIEALRKGNKEYEQQKALLDLINEAKKDGLGLSDEDIERIEKTSEKLGEQRDQLDKLKEKNDDAKRASKDFAHVIGTAFEDAIVKGKGLRDVMSGLLEDISRIILRTTVTKPFENWLTEATKSAGTSDSSGGGGGDFFGSMVSSIGSAFGSMAFAEGGDPPVGKASLVGERGPELFVPKTSGTIISNDNMKNMGGGPVFNVDMRGASVEAVQRLELLVKQVNGSIEGRAVGAVKNDRWRNAASWG